MTIWRRGMTGRATGVLAACGMAAVLLIGPASPASAAPREIFHSEYSDTSVLASSSFTEGCSLTTVDVYGYKAPEDGYTAVYLESVFDTCTGASVQTIGLGSATTFKVRGDLSTARLVAELLLTVYSYPGDGSGVESDGGSISIDLTFAAPEKPESYKYRQVSKDAGAIRRTETYRGVFSTSARVDGHLGGLTVDSDSGTLEGFISRVRAASLVVYEK